MPSYLSEKSIIKPNKNIYIRTVSLANRKSCPTCSLKLDGRLIYSAGEYVNVKWNTIQHFCELCFSSNLKKDCEVYKAKSGKEIKFISYQNTKIPEWLKL
jgi:hypothetical protein